MYVYVATSWRNEFQPEVVRLLREDGHEVYDFRGEEGFSWREVDHNWATWTPEQYLIGLEHQCAERGFERDMHALMRCDACVYVMPCGPSASMEMGYCVGAGKLVIAYIPALREPDLMVKMAHLITNRFDEVRERCVEYSHFRVSTPQTDPRGKP
jgi:nucleoside 2-deoxyribosyltransferase